MAVGARDSYSDFFLKSLICDSFIDAYNTILKLKNKNGLSLNDILNEIHDILVDYILTGKNEDDINVEKLAQKKINMILNKISKIEFNQSVNTTENIQLSALVAVFKL